MAKVLYLVHRMPYPPNKGDKVRSYHLLRQLCERHEVLLGTFIDDPDDWAHVPTVASWCKAVKVCRLNPRRAKLASLQGLLTGEALSLPYYRNHELQAWVDDCVRSGQVDAVVVFSSTMAQYVMKHPLPMHVDLVDVDSAKWSDYAPRHAWPMSWVYAREGRRLLDEEAKIVQRARSTWLSTAKEVALFESLCPDLLGRVQPLCNGVDAQFFSPSQAGKSPYGGRPTVAFTGAMDYWPNVDAVQWFVAEMMPALRQRVPGVQFYIVGRSPTDAVRALAGPDVHVTGTVDDVRPYIAHAHALVAPLRLARGVQNKLLEAMSMGKPVVTSTACAQAIDAVDQVHLHMADDAAAHVDRLQRLFDNAAAAHAMGDAARAFVQAHFSWDAHLSAVTRALETA